ncbi:MAG: aminoacyl-histidine dipeptidase [Tannerellaceae bacterium]|jgi:dipeptidase D|nr:aminoacyl-histidine dipeptidase [Tannerellaceae bacterium]
MSSEIKNLTPTNVWKYFYELTQIPRPTGSMEAVVKHVAEFGRSIGLETSIDRLNNVLIRKPATAGKESCGTIILQSHLDMVPQKNHTVEHNFLTDPIDAYVEGDWVTARDTTLGADNGIGVALAMALLEDKTLSHGPLEALFTVNEEVGMDGAFGLKPGALRGRTLINCDSEDDSSLFVGCAGGSDMNISFQYKDENCEGEGAVAVKVSLTGLKGGHSGVDIHLGRANANKLMFRFLKEAVSGYGARLSWVSGGSMRNAIPREAFAIIVIPENQADLLWEIVSDYREIFRSEYASVDPEISFEAEKAEMPSTLIPEEVQDDLINAVEGCVNGVAGMLHDFPGTVESSSNLAIIQSGEGLIEIKILVRSSSESRKTSVCSSLESIFALAGAKVEYGGSYNGWQPNIESPILKIVQSAYKNLHGQEPPAKVMHAGLECGIIQGIYPDMDMISIGPDIEFPHSPDERVRIKSVEKVWNLLRSVLEGVK